MQKPIKTKISLIASTILVLSALLVSGSVSTVSAASTFGFGNHQIGGASNSTFGGLFLSNFTAPNNLGNITQIQVYMATGGAACQAVIYSDINGVPVTLLAQSSPVNVPGTEGEWVTFDINYTGIPAFTYWIGVLFEGAATYYYGQSTNGTALYSSSGAMNATLCPSGTATMGDTLCVFAVYTPISTGGQGSNWLQNSLLWVAIIGAVLAIIVGATAVLIRKGQKDDEKKAAAA
jgi:hypothetical protein